MVAPAISPTVVGELFHAACRAARPDPIKLAAKLFKLELAGEYGFDDTIETYGDVLGESGQTEMARLAKEAWGKLRPISVNRKGASDNDDFIRSRLFTILDRRATHTGDIEARIKLRRENLSSQPSYLDLAQFCEKHGRPEEAIQWVDEALVFCSKVPAMRDCFADWRTFLHAPATRRGQTPSCGRGLRIIPHGRSYARIIETLPSKERQKAVDQALAILKKAASEPKSRLDHGFVLSISDGRTAIRRSLGCRRNSFQPSLAKSRPWLKRAKTAIPIKLWLFIGASVEALVTSGGNYNYEEAKTNHLANAADRGTKRQGRPTSRLRTKSSECPSCEAKFYKAHVWVVGFATIPAMNGDHDSLAELQAKLAALDQEREALVAKINAATRYAADNESAERGLKGRDHLSIDRFSTSEQKLALFRRLFRGRDDLLPKKRI